MRLKTPLLTLMVILTATAIATAQNLDPKDFLTMTLQQNRVFLQRAVGSVLDCPWLTEADRAELKKAVQPAEDALAALEKNGQNATIETIQAEQRKVVEASGPATALLNSRSDYKWMSTRATFLLEIEARLLEDNPDKIASAFKTAAPDDAQQAKLKTILDKFAADLAEWKKKVAANQDPKDIKTQMSLAASLAATKFAALQSVHALLSPEQRFAYEWALPSMMPNVDDVAFRIVGYAAQPVIHKAPQAGTYVLKTSSGTKELVSITLKKGDPIGFSTKELLSVMLKGDKLIGVKNTAQSVIAIAADKTFDVPAEKLGDTHWEFIPSKP